MDFGMLLNRLPKSRDAVVHVLQKFIPVSIPQSWVKIIRKVLNTPLDMDLGGYATEMRQV